MDVFTDGTSDYLLRNWDPKAPKKITPWNDQGVKGTMGTAAPGLYNTYYALGSTFTLTHVAACTFDQQRSLKEFVTDSPDVKLDIVKYRGNDAPKLTMQHPDTKAGGKFRDTVISVILDPASYMITEMEIQLPETALGVKSRQVLHVQKFREFADGAVLPEKVTANSYHQGGSGVNELTMVTAKSTVNQELPADALDFRFPEGAMVYDHATLRGGKVTVHVWGPDGRPARSLSDMSELGPPPSDADARQNNRGWVSYAVYGIGGPVVIGLVLFLLWRRRK
ncbi:MAG TPA: hypothetical protein VMP01_18200 [Pirellulaceae bacterium]|nr:hypothetical protein [Pirellulaceae bacterium]